LIWTGLAFVAYWRLYIKFGLQVNGLPPWVFTGGADAAYWMARLSSIAKHVGAYSFNLRVALVVYLHYNHVVIGNSLIAGLVISFAFAPLACISLVLWYRYCVMLVRFPLVVVCGGCCSVSQFNLLDRAFYALWKVYYGFPVHQDGKFIGPSSTVRFMHVLTWPLCQRPHKWLAQVPVCYRYLMDADLSCNTALDCIQYALLIPYLSLSDRCASIANTGTGLVYEFCATQV
jgi:hypothetical protein